MWQVQYEYKYKYNSRSFWYVLSKQVASKITESNISPTSYTEESNFETICLTSVNEEEVNKGIHGLKDSSTGWDNVYSKIVKQTSQYIIPMLTHFLYLSVTNGVFPRLENYPNWQE